jgi:hypothetical protein
VHGQWTRLGEPGNLWLAMAWLLLFGFALVAPIELRRAQPRRSS